MGWALNYFWMLWYCFYFLFCGIFSAIKPLFLVVECYSAIFRCYSIVLDNYGIIFSHFGIILVFWLSFWCHFRVLLHCFYNLFLFLYSHSHEPYFLGSQRKREATAKRKVGERKTREAQG